MSQIYFAAENLSANILVGYGSFKMSSPKTQLPEFHFLTMLCEETLCIYSVNLETGVYYKAGASTSCDNEERSLQGFLRAVASFLTEVVDSPSGEEKLTAILEQGGQDIFWNQYHKARFLCRDTCRVDTALTGKLIEYFSNFNGISLDSFTYCKLEA